MRELLKVWPVYLQTINTRDQLYFNRVNPSALILHHRRYLTRTKSAHKPLPRTCLLYVRWPLAILSVNISEQPGHETELTQACALIMILSQFPPGGFVSEGMVDACPKFASPSNEFIFLATAVVVSNESDNIVHRKRTQV